MTSVSSASPIAAIAAKKLKRAVKIRLDRDEDMTATGKRHDFAIDYEVGFDFDKAWDYENGFFLTSHPTRIGKLLAHYELYKRIVELPGQVVECGVFLDRPSPDDPTLYASDHLGLAAKLEIPVSEAPLALRHQ